MKPSFFAPALASALMLSVSAHATLITYNLDFSTTGQNIDTVTGTITIDTSAAYTHHYVFNSPADNVYTFPITTTLTYSGPDFAGKGTPTIVDYSQDTAYLNGGFDLNVFSLAPGIDIGIPTLGGFTDASVIGIGTLPTTINVTYNETSFQMIGTMTQVSDIPEPASLGLFATALAALPRLRRRRRLQG